jgi:hypothetical protein
LSCAGMPVGKTDKKDQGTHKLAWVDILTFCLRISFDEFLELRLPARGCNGVNDTANDDRAFAFDHIDLFRGQLLQVRKVDLGNELHIEQYQSAVMAELLNPKLTLGPAWAISAVRVASSPRMSFQEAVRCSCVVAETSLRFKSRKRGGQSYMMNSRAVSTSVLTVGGMRAPYSATCSYTPQEMTVTTGRLGPIYLISRSRVTDIYDSTEDSPDER